MTKPSWSPLRVRLGEIQPWAENPRFSTKAQAQRLIESERKFGQPLPFLLGPIDAGRYPLLDGHQRLAAWLTVYGPDYVVDAMVAGRALTEDEHKELIVTLHSGAVGSWDWNALSGWSADDLQAWGMDQSTLDGWGKDYSNLKEMIQAEQPVPEFKEYDESVENEVEYLTCPHCGKTFPK